MSSLRVVGIFSLVAAALAWTGCRGGSDGPAPADSSRTSPEPRTFHVRGVVRELKPDGQTILIEHEPITNYMAAMTMPFRARPTNSLLGLKPGDAVEFRLWVGTEQSWIDQITPLGRGTNTNLNTITNDIASAAAAAEGPPGVTKVAAATNEFYLSQMPAFALTNEFGQPVQWRDFRGQALAVTFFFTRCPIPEYCPRLARNFQGAIAQLKALPNGPTNFHFLSISFDPLDSPLLLRAYGMQYHYDSNYWSFVTGKSEHIRELARGFGVPITEAGNSYTHGFNTLIFDATGRLQAMWPIGGDMTGQIVGEITKGANAQK